jgi:cytochrome P450
MSYECPSAETSDHGFVEIARRPHALSGSRSLHRSRLWMPTGSLSIGRRDRHAAFGLGIHRCIGSTLVRMEMRVALEEWLGQFPDLH